MNTESAGTETVVRNHLQAFMEQKGIAAIVSDYDENARFYSLLQRLQRSLNHATQRCRCPASSSRT